MRLGCVPRERATEYGNALKSDHGIFRNEKARIFGFESELDFLSEEKPGIGDVIAHLDEVFESQIGDGVGVDLPRALEFLKYCDQSGSMAIEKFQHTVQSSNAQFMP